jgi:hypothetical protein
MCQIGRSDAKACERSHRRLRSRRSKRLSDLNHHEARIDAYGTIFGRAALTAEAALPRFRTAEYKHRPNISLFVRPKTNIGRV